MKLTVIGIGYVGLVTGTCLAEVGHSVVCVDVDAAKITRLKTGKIPIYESGLQELVIRNLKEGRLSFTTSLQEGIEASDVIFNAVGTPMGKTHEADLQYIMAVARDFARMSRGYKIFVIKSTVPVGTGVALAKMIEETIKSSKDYDGLEFDVVSNPEFLREGTAVKDFTNPDRIVVGLDHERGDTLKVRNVMKKLYEPIVRVGSPLIFTDIYSSEIIKYASNAFLASKISFINEMASFCEVVGGDIKEVARGIGLDKRIGPKFLHAGMGYGGSCFPKDVKALIQTGEKVGAPFAILKAVDTVNEHQCERMKRKIKKALGSLRKKTVAVWGLSFKPKTDDMREASSLSIVPYLVQEGAIVRLFDPVSNTKAKAIFDRMDLGDLIYCNKAYEACRSADALIILTEWDEFRTIDFKQLKLLMKGHSIIDGRNLYEPHDIEAQGFNYYCFGR